MLDADELAELNAELLTQSWGSLAGERGAAIDAPVMTFRRDHLELVCANDCGEPGIEDAAQRWTQRLWERGTPMEGPVDVAVGPSTLPASDAPAGTPTWTGTTPIVSPRRWVHVDDPSDVVALRSLRAGLSGGLTSSPRALVIVDGTVRNVGVLDAWPYDTEIRGTFIGGRPW